MFEKDEAKITDKMGLILKGIRLQKGFSREIIAERAKIGVRHLAAIEKMNNVRQVSRCSVGSCGLWESPLTEWFIQKMR